MQARNSDSGVIRKTSTSSPAGQQRGSFLRALAEKHRQTLMGELEKMLAPPAPPPEPEPEVTDVDLGSPSIADENFNPGYWLQKPIFRTR